VRAAPEAAVIEQLRLLREQLVSLDTEIGTDEALLLGTIDGETDVLDGLRAVTRMVLEAEGQAGAVKRRISDLQGRKHRYEARAEKGRAFINAAMATLGIKSLPAEDFSAWVRAGVPKPEITDMDALPDSFVRIKREPDLLLIGGALRNGQKVTGASLSNAEPVLVIRV